jgi:hypothetical protein
MKYVVGSEIKLGDFLLPSLKGVYEKHPDLDEMGFILIPSKGNGDYFWARKDLVQERYSVKYGARGPVHYIEINEGEEESFPSTRGGLMS